MHGKSFWFIQTEKYLVRVTYSGTVQRGGGGGGDTVCRWTSI